MSIEKAYNKWAQQYDTNQNKTRDLDRKTTIQTLKTYHFSSVIELGCGTGKNTAYLLSRSDKVIGLDFSEEMLAKAKSKITDERVRFQKANLNAPWEVENMSADLITSSLVLEHIKNLDFIFQQTNLKLKPKGLFFINEYHPFKQYIGKKARFETEYGLQELETFVHNTTEYLTMAKNNGFQLLELNEWFDEGATNEIPRLISFVFQK